MEQGVQDGKQDTEKESTGQAGQNRVRNSGREFGQGHPVCRPGRIFRRATGRRETDRAGYQTV